MTRAVAVLATLGTRVSFVVIAWFALGAAPGETTGAAWAAWVVGSALLAYVVVGVVGMKPLERWLPRQRWLIADLISALTVASLAFAPSARWSQIGLVAVLGAVRAISDRSREQTDWPASTGGDGRRSATSSPPRGWVISAGVVAGGFAVGAIVALLGAAGVLWLNALVFAVCAAAAATIADADADADRAEAIGDTTLDVRQLVAKLRRSPALIVTVAVVIVVNLLGQTAAVALLVAWDRGLFRSTATSGLVGGAFVVGMLGAGVVFTALAARPGRLVAAVIGVVVGGGAVAVSRGLAPASLVVVCVSVVAGIALWSVTPAIDVLISRRPRQGSGGRIGGLVTAVAYGGIPLGTWAAGWIANGLSLVAAIAVATCVYLVAMTIPVIGHRTWRRVGPDAPLAEISVLAPPKLPARVSVTLAYADGQWLVEVRKGRALLGSRHPVKSVEALRMLSLLDVPTVSDRVEQALSSDQFEASRQVERMRNELAELETKLSGLTEMVAHTDAGKSA